MLLFFHHANVVIDDMGLRKKVSFSKNRKTGRELILHDPYSASKVDGEVMANGIISILLN